MAPQRHSGYRDSTGPSERQLIVSNALKVFLIGLPGSGKTTLAREVSDKINIPYFDLDDEIEKDSQQKVHDIFKSGESAFRKIETETLKKVIEQNTKFILATGGGAPCFNDNLNTMKRSGTVIFLHVPATEIINRISKQSINRPLLKGDLAERIFSLHEQRVNVYKQAQFVLEGNNIQASDIIRLIG